MTLKFDKIKWVSDSKDAFKAGALQSIILNFESEVVEINCDDELLILPFINYRYGGGIEHHCFTIHHPYEKGCLNVRIFDDGSVGLVDFSRMVPTHLTYLMERILDYSLH